MELEAGEYQVPMLVKDSGSPSQRTLTQVNVTVCLCDSYGDCRSESGAFLGSRVGISFIALIIMIACSSLLLGECHDKENAYLTKIKSILCNISRWFSEENDNENYSNPAAHRIYSPAKQTHILEHQLFYLRSFY